MAVSERPRLMAELAVVSRRYMASYALFNQALADHLGLHPDRSAVPEPADAGGRSR